jgi:nickel superoxide dismutase
VLKSFFDRLDRVQPAPTASAHCDGPCGIYDPAAARITGEAVRSMTKKLLALTPPDSGDAAAVAAYNNTVGRFTAIKEEQAELTKHELLILWTDYFNPPHLTQFPDLHDTFWKAAKLCSTCKVEVSAQHADELMEAIEGIHKIFWQSKGREIPFYLAGG